MNPFASFFLIAALVAVVGVLLFGLWNLAKGGSGNTSQKLMRFRIIAQLVAIIALAVAYFTFNPGA